MTNDVIAVKLKLFLTNVKMTGFHVLSEYRGIDD